MSRELSKFLRHVAGKPKRSPTGTRRDDGAWVAWLDVLSVDYLWHHNHRYKRESDPIQKKFIEQTRVHAMCCCMIHNYRKGKKTRLHAMAVKIEPKLLRDEDPETVRLKKYLVENRHAHGNFGPDECGGKIAIDRIRATSGWSEGEREGTGSVLNMDKLSIKMTDFMTNVIPYAFHMTTMRVFQSIVEHGLKPGGRDGCRSFSFFAAFPPFGRLVDQSSVKWEQRSIRLGTDLRDSYLLLVIPAYVLRTSFNGRLDLDGHFVTEEEIPFLAFQSAWFGSRHEHDGKLVWRRLLIGKNEQLKGVKVTTGVMNLPRIPKNPTWGDLASRAYEALKLVDNNLDREQVDELMSKVKENPPDLL